jgi:hypothetical protein
VGLREGKVGHVDVDDLRAVGGHLALSTVLISVDTSGRLAIKSVAL